MDLPAWKFVGTVLLAAVFSIPCLAAAESADSLAFKPENPPAMQPLPDQNTPAYRAARWFRHGVNLGNYLEVPPGETWGVQVTAGEFAQMKHEGFDHVRIPIGWQHYAGPAPEFALASEIFSKADFAVTNALASGLAVMINVHQFDGLDEDPAGNTEKFLALWRQIAVHYAGFPERLIFELDNEPHQNATTALMNPIYARAISLIRKTNPHRTIVVEPGVWGSIDELKYLMLPTDDNLMVSVHCYEPFLFTHQGATWAGPDTKTTGIQFPGPPATPLAPDPSFQPSPEVAAWIHDYNTLPAAENPSSPRAFSSRLHLVHAWSDYYRRPVYLGEFGAFTRADPVSRARFYAAFRKNAEAEQIGWAIWDWSAGFRYWDKKNGRPMPGMAEALFGRQP